MVIARAQYKNAGTLQTALIRIVQRRADYMIATNIGGEDIGVFPAWFQTATTEAEARRIGNHFHAELKTRYGMRRLA
jgi:hypothetical protein